MATIIGLIISRSSHVVRGAHAYAQQHTLRAGIVRIDRELFHQIYYNVHYDSEK